HTPPRPRHIHSFPTRRSSDLTYYELIDDELKWSDGVALYVRTRGDTGLVTGELRRMLARVGEGIAPSETATMEQEIETSLWQERSEEHTSELQSRFDLVCRLL